MRYQGRCKPAPQAGVLGRTAVGVVSCLLAVSCSGASPGLGDAEGGIGLVTDRAPTADTESATVASGAPGDSADGTVDPDRPDTTGGSGSDPAGTERPIAGGHEEGEESSTSGPDRSRLDPAPGLSADDPFEAALGRYWALLHRARAEPWSYDEAELDAVAVGAGRDRFRRRVENLGAAEAIVARPEPSFEVRLSGMRIGAGVAVGEECVLDDLIHVVVRNPHTGERYEPPLVTDERVFTSRYGVTFQLVDGVWKVADRVLIEDWEGVAGCANGW